MFDQLSKKAKATASQEDMVALWRAAYALDHWYFIARGEMTNITPFVGIVDETPMLLGFTDSNKAIAFAKLNGLADEKGSPPLLHISPAGTASMAASLSAKGVEALLMNHGPFGFFAPLQNLTPMLNYYSSDSQE